MTFKNVQPSSLQEMTLTAWSDRWQHWRAEGPSWLQRQARRIYRRWVYACSGFFAVLLLVGLWQAEKLEEVWQAQGALADLRSQLAAGPRDLLGGSGVSRDEATQALAQNLAQSLAHLPGSSSRSLLWPALQQSFERHHLVLLSLQPVSDAVAAPLPSQAVALRLRGRFDDWGRAWADLSEGVPVWTMERVRITPQAHAPWVEIDVLLRVWLRADHDGEKAWRGQVSSNTPPSQGPSVFFHGGSSDPGAVMALASPSLEEAGPTPQTAAVDSPDPLHWPIAGLRLLGVWHGPETAHAILAFGPHWVSAQVGQRVSQEGHRLVVIGDHAVSLRAGLGPLRVLNFEKASR